MTEYKTVLEQFNLTGQVALITGGSRGLGRAIAQALAEAGATTVICSRTLADCEKAAAEIAAATGRTCAGVAMDVTEEASVEAGVAGAVKRFGRLDVLVNSAGINIRRPIEELTLAEFQSVQATNLTGTWLGCRAAARIMKPKRSGSVINLASALAKVALPERTPYCASKFGVLGITQALALEWAESGVRCNAICPGPFLTEMNTAIAADPEKARMVVGQTALNRWADLREITGAALYLASPASTYVTGSAMSVDGGWTAR